MPPPPARTGHGSPEARTAAFRDRLVVLPRGVVMAAGPPVGVLAPALTERVREVRAGVETVDGAASTRSPRRSLRRNRGTIGTPYAPC
ncbi:hypothetical protein V1L54_17180 [Streptomyces sp. TRM 70361]|uniref:hypothetical protein n=1 Tax=Streptomyces sp. TRM 70361 TaxID=3116553 RepID=UPI002E7BBE34|nr:hypothetical protein [Streptomyces sp. TRM 70361]MEE1941114.1 hypothetical protein [Streptomyces sp. TRM 70361]